MKFINKLVLCGIAAVMLFACISVSADSYNDIRDEQTGFAVSVLDAFNVVSGFPDGGYHPGEELTRAQFSKLSVSLLGLEDKLTGASLRTLFSDVTGAHWAAAYVNLAYDNGLIRGYGNGKFGPDDSVNYAESLTIMLRMLGYSDSDIGTVYPDDYLRFARKLGLTDGVSCEPGENITRGEAAILLVNMISADTKSGNPFYKKLASSSVAEALLLDTSCISADGRLDCVKLYANGQTVWYRKSESISSFIGREGTALLNDDGKIMAFLPGDSKYSVLEGILIANSKRATSGSTLPYEVEVYTEEGLVSYPRAGTVSQNLVGSSGTLIINAEGYASAFVSDGIDSYTLTKNAILLKNNTVNDEGEENCASFYVGTKTVYYELDYSADIDRKDIGKKGTVLINADGYATAFVPDDEEYTVEYGVLVSYDSDEATFLIDGDHEEYELDTSLSSSLKGAYGIILINSDGELEAFVKTEDSAGGTVKDGVILLDEDCTSSNRVRHSAKFLENGKIVWYPQDDILDRDLVGCAGTLVLDEDGVVVDFYPNGDDYDIDVAILLELTSSRAKFYMYDEIVTVRLDDDCAVSDSDIGKEGYVLYSSYHRVLDFYPTENSASQTMTDYGILLNNGVKSDDGRTVIVDFYVNGRISTYACETSIPKKQIGSYGALILDEDDTVIAYVYDSSSSDGEEVVSVSADGLVTEDGSYTVKGSLTVVADGDVTTWSDVYDSIGEGDTVYLYFTKLGKLDMIVVG